MAKKVCKQCKIFYDGETCPLCKGAATAASFQGRINVLDMKSKVAAKMNIAKEGEYAIKVR